MMVQSNPLAGGMSMPGMGTPMTGLGASGASPMSSPGLTGTTPPTDNSSLQNQAAEQQAGSANMAPLLAMLSSLGSQSNSGQGGAQQDPIVAAAEEIQALEQLQQQQQQAGDQQGAQQTQAEIQQLESDLQAVLGQNQSSGATDPSQSSPGGGDTVDPSTDTIVPNPPTAGAGGDMAAPPTGGGGGGGGSTDPSSEAGSANAAPSSSGSGASGPVATAPGMSVQPGQPPPTSSPAWNVANQMSKYTYQFYYNSEKSVGQTESQQSGNCDDLAHAAQAMFAQEGIKANVVLGNVQCDGYSGGHYWLEYQDPTTGKETFFDPTAAASHHSASAAFTGLDGPNGSSSGAIYSS